MLEIRTITTSTEFLAMRADWEDLLARMPTANIFLTFDWLATWWLHYGGAAQLCILAAYQEKTLMGLAPLMIHEHRFVRVPIFRRIAFLGTGVSDRLDILLASGHEQEILEAIITHLGNWQWDIIDLHEVPEGSVTARLLPELAEPLGARVEVMAQSVCPVLTLPEDPETHLASLGKKLRKNLSYYDRQLKKKHTVTVDFLEGGSRLTDDMEAFLQLYRRYFADRPGTSKLTGNEFAAFRQEVATQFAPHGRVLLALLRIDGTPTAGELCFLYRGTCYLYNLCYDTDWERASIGTFLQWECLRHAITLGCQEFDFLRGDEAYKYRWGALPRRQVRIQIARETLKLRLLQAGMLLARSQPCLGVRQWIQHGLRLWGRVQCLAVC